MTPLNLLEQLQQPVGIPFGGHARELGPSAPDTTFDATIRERRRLREPSEPGDDGPGLQTDPPDGGVEPAPSHDQQPTETVEDTPAASAESANNAPETGQPDAEATATPARPDGPAQQGTADPSWTSGSFVLRFGLKEPVSPNGEVAPGPAELRPPTSQGLSPSAGMQSATAVPREVPPSAPQRVAIEPVPIPLPLSPGGSQQTGSGEGQTGAGNETLGRHLAEQGPQPAMEVLDLPERGGREARAAAAVEARSSDKPANGNAGGRASSPAAELARLLLPEARIGELPEPARTPGERTASEVTEPVRDRPVPAAQGEPAEATIKSARVIDAHESLPLRLAGGPGGTEPLSSVERLTRVLASSAGPRTSYLKLQLEPPQLGQLRVEVRLNHDAVSIRLQAETAAVKNLLADRVGSLKTALEQQGMHVERVTVEVRPPSPNTNTNPEGTSERPLGEREHAASHDQSNSHNDESGRAGDSGDDARSGGGAEYESGPPEAEESGGLVTAESSVDVFV